MNAEPRKEHHWLERLVGEWTYESEAPMAPGQPPVKHTGTESVRSLGGVWVLCEGRGEKAGEVPGEPGDADDARLRSIEGAVRGHLHRIDDDLPLALRR